MRYLFASTLLLLSGCVGIPEGVNAIDDFDLQRYLGTWHEIARLDHKFERGLTNVTAVYTLRDDGGIDVLNRGYNKEKGEWKEADGKAYFVGDSDVGRLKVSFFGPFYGGYNIIALDHENYAYSMVCGPKRSYLWILAREKKLDSDILNKLITYAKTLGFETDKLIFVEQEEG